MVVIGADLHKRSHTLVAVDGSGRKLAEKTVNATPAGHLEVRHWLSRWPDRTIALEDCRRSAGDTKTEAIRALRRRISDEVFRRMRQDSTGQEARRDSLATAA